MLKGYWILRVDISNPEQFAAYMSATLPVLSKYGARFLVRGGRSECVEGSARARSTVIEFPSYQAALDCWQSPEYSAAAQLREGAAVMDVVIIEGYGGPQPNEIN